MDQAEVLKIINQAKEEGWTELDLSNKGLTELPPEIGQLTNLTALYLDKNDLNDLPSEIGQLTNLTYIGLSFNSLKLLPTDFWQLPNLRELYLYSNQLREVPLEIEQLTKLTRLSLGRNGISKLPIELWNLTNLIELDLSANDLTNLPAQIGQLINLLSFRIGGIMFPRTDPLKRLPPELFQLTNLRMLDLGWNGLTELPRQIAQLTNLIDLNLECNYLNDPPSELFMLNNLMALNLSNNGLNVLPMALFQLTNLSKLFLQANELSELPPDIAHLTNLRELNLNRNQLKRLPTELFKLTNLINLDLWENDLSELPSEIGQLTNLQGLFLLETNLSKLPPEIGQLTNLEHLFLHKNNLSELPVEIGQLTNLQLLNLRENPLPIPPEILDKTDEPATIINYYLQLLQEETRPLNEAKVVFIGQGSVGKTSLVNKLIYETFDPHENITEGINIENWDIEVETENSLQDIHLNVWDFGGQEIMHATHQFFLTKRSVYVLVVDSRLGEEENRIDYWLKIINSFGGDSPVILVGNKTDQKAFDIDRRGIRRKYPNITAIVATSCQSGRGIDNLKDYIAREVNKLENVHEPFPTKWFNVKDHLSYMKAKDVPFISLAEYRNLCETEKVITDINQHTLLGFMHDLGIIVNFQDDPHLMEMGILNPEWVTNGVYKAINDRQVFENDGVLTRTRLHQILTGKEYPKEKHQFIVDLMRKFELCFVMNQTNDQFLIPDLLPKEEKFLGDGWQREKILAFKYHYDVLPISIITRFIVRMHENIHKRTVWRTGVLLKDGKNEGTVIADMADRKIQVRIRGAENTRRDMLSKIRGQFDAIHNSIANITVDEHIPLPETSETVKYSTLLIYEEKGKYTYTHEIDNDLIEFDVRDLLDGVESVEDRHDRREDRLRYKGEYSDRRPKGEQESQTSDQPRRVEANIGIAVKLLAIVIAFAIILLLVLAAFALVDNNSTVLLASGVVFGLIAVGLFVLGLVAERNFIEILRIVIPWGNSKSGQGDQ